MPATWQTNATGIQIIRHADYHAAAGGPNRIKQWAWSVWKPIEGATILGTGHAGSLDAARTAADLKILELRGSP